MTIDLKKIKPNIPQVSLQDYFYLIAGIPKSGKTTLFAKFVEKYLGDINKGLIIAFEKGYTALKVNAVDVEDWDDFEEVVDQLVEQKDKLPFEFIGIDTCDVMWELVQEKVVAEWNIENPSKRAKDINGVGAKKAGGQGFGVGYQRAKQKVRKQIDRLMKAGYGIMAITHSKREEIEEKNGLEYDQLVVSLSNSAREVFVNMADFITFLTVEKEKGDDGKVESKRYIYFRTDGYVEAGSRFPNIPERIEYDVQGFIDAIENAIKSEFSEGVDLNKLKKEQEKVKEEKAKEFVENDKKNNPDKIKEELTEIIKGLDDTNKKKVSAKFKEIFGGTANYNKIDDVNQLKEALEYVQNL